MWHSAGNLAAYLEIGNRKSKATDTILVTDLPVSLSIFREASDPYWKFVTLNIKKDMGEIIVVVLVLYVFCKIVKGIFGGFSKSSFRHDK